VFHPYVLHGPLRSPPRRQSVCPLSGARRSRNHCSELEHEAEVVADSPSLWDAAVFKWIHEHDVSLVVAGRPVEFAKWSRRPVTGADPVLDDAREDVPRLRKASRSTSGPGESPKISATVRLPRKARRRVGIMTWRDDDFLARVEPSARPSGGGLEHGSSGYAEGLRRARAERRASLEPGGAEQLHNNRREAMHKAYVVAAGVIGAAVVAAAAVAVLVFAGVFAVSPGVGGSHRAETLEQQPSSTTPGPSSPSTAGPPSPNTTAETGPSALPPSNPVAIPDTTAGTQVPARSSSNPSGSQQLSSASSPLLSGAPAPDPPTASTACQSKSRQRGHRSKAGAAPLAAGQPLRCSKS
jgi:hypothetical protein